MKPTAVIAKTSSRRDPIPLQTGLDFRKRHRLIAMPFKELVVRQTQLLLLVILCAGCSGRTTAEFDQTIECRSPNGKRETKVIKRWKYDSIQELISRFVTTDSDMPLSELQDKIAEELTQEQSMMMGNVRWHVECVVLEMETAGQLTRSPESGSPLPTNVRLSK